MPHLQRLKDERSLKKFCKEKGLSYFIVQMISIRHPRQYPDCLHELLEIFGYKTERGKIFKVFIKSFLSYFFIHSLMVLDRNP